MNIKKIWIIGVKDFKTYFISPIGYLVISSYIFVIGYMFYMRLIFFLNQKMMSAQYAQYGQTMDVSLNDAIIKPVYGSMNLIMLFVIPLITMRLLSEEKKQKTMELLLTSPISHFEIVAGKFLSAMLLIGVTFAFTIAYPVILYIGGNPDMGQVFTMYLGLLCVSACYIAIGLFWSSMTENQIISAVLTFISLLFMWIIDWSAQALGSTLGDVTGYLSIIRHFDSFFDGTINSKDVVYYLSFTFFGLFLSYLGIESKNWK